MRPKVITIEKSKDIDFVKIEIKKKKKNKKQKKKKKKKKLMLMTQRICGPPHSDSHSWPKLEQKAQLLYGCRP
jgi:hypothetical protein